MPCVQGNIVTDAGSDFLADFNSNRDKYRTIMPFMDSLFHLMLERFPNAGQGLRLLPATTAESMAVCVEVALEDPARVGLTPDEAGRLLPRTPPAAAAQVPYWGCLSAACLVRGA